MAQKSEKVSLPVPAGEEGGAVKEGNCGLGEMYRRGVESRVTEEGLAGGGSVETGSTIMACVLNLSYNITYITHALVCAPHLAVGWVPSAQILEE